MAAAVVEESNVLTATVSVTNLPIVRRKETGILIIFSSSIDNERDGKVTFCRIVGI